MLKKAEDWNQTLISRCVSIFIESSLLLIHFLKWILAKNAEMQSLDLFVMFTQQ